MMTSKHLALSFFETRHDQFWFRISRFLRLPNTAHSFSLAASVCDCYLNVRRLFVHYSRSIYTGLIYDTFINQIYGAESDVAAAVLLANSMESSRKGTLAMIDGDLNVIWISVSHESAAASHFSPFRSGMKRRRLGILSRLTSPHLTLNFFHCLTAK